jgi:hypothetical protein
LGSVACTGTSNAREWQPKKRRPPQAEAPAEPASAAASVPAIRNPIDPSLATASAPTAGDPQALWRHGLVELLGQSAVVRFVQTDDFSRRLVVTVDNLARAHAAPRLWPVNPTPGRFNVTGNGELRNIAAENASRYTPLVTMIAAVDARQAAALYVRMYPQLQKAYEELGYPGRYFNDRVVEVIDHLLDTRSRQRQGRWSVDRGEGHRALDTALAAL